MTVEVVRAAVVQMDVRIGETEANLERVIERLAEAAESGARLVVFPELALSGYCFNSLEDAKPFALTSADATIASVCAEAERLDVTVVMGFFEVSGGNYFNSAVIASAVGGASNVYRKTHLPTIGVDRFISKGNHLDVYDTSAGKLGVLICYDMRFPEAARTLGLKGAEIITLPTNWPEGAESSRDFIGRTRAWENRVYLLAANRVGVERSRRFIGSSQIVSPTGELLAKAGENEETILYADLDLRLTHQKRIVIEPGEWELDITGDRRPDLYGELTRSG